MKKLKHKPSLMFFGRGDPANEIFRRTSPAVERSDHEVGLFRQVVRSRSPQWLVSRLLIFHCGQLWVLSSTQKYVNDLWSGIFIYLFKILYGCSPPMRNLEIRTDTRETIGNLRDFYMK
jgi:hypothetical protein